MNELMRCVLTSEEIIVVGEEALKVADALTESSFRILQLISEERLDVSSIAKRLNLSEAYVSEQIHRLEELKLVKVSYEPGRRGIRKICELAIKRIVMVIKP